MVDLRKQASGGAPSSLRSEAHLIDLDHERFHHVRSHKLKVRVPAASHKYVQRAAPGRRLRRSTYIQCAIALLLPEKKLSNTTTSCPLHMSLSTKCDPTNPAPPVTRIRFLCLLPSFLTAGKRCVLVKLKLFGQSATIEGFQLSLRAESVRSCVGLDRPEGGGEAVRRLLLRGPRYSDWSCATAWLALRFRVTDGDGAPSRAARRPVHR